MKLRSAWSVLAFAAAVATQAQVSTINGMKVDARWWNDFPSSTFSSVNNYPTTVSISDHGLTSTGNGYANRHIFRFSADGGATAYQSPGGNDTFEVTTLATVNSTGVTGGFPRRIEGGPWCRTPIIGGWWSEFQMILTNDGEVACFGAPIPFYSFTVQQGVSYPQGTQVRVGYRYYRDTDNKMKWVWIYDNLESPPLTLEFISGTEGSWDFPNKGFRPHGYTWNGGDVMGTEFGFYTQIMPNQGSPTTIDADVAWNSIVMKSIGTKGVVTLNDITTNGDMEPVSVQVMNGATILQSMNTQLDAVGRFSFRSTVAAGSHDVYVEGATHLRKKVTGVVFTSSGANIGSISLINGDCDGDNEVGPGDFGVISGAYGSVVGDGNFVAGADLDRDGEVGPSDFGILSSSYGLMGD